MAQVKSPPTNNASQSLFEACRYNLAAAHEQLLNAERSIEVSIHNDAQMPAVIKAVLIAKWRVEAAQSYLEILEEVLNET